MVGGRGWRFGIVSLFLSDAALSFVPSGTDTAFFVCSRYVDRISETSGGISAFVGRFSYAIFLLRGLWPGNHGSHIAVMGNECFSSLPSVSRPLGLDSCFIGS